MAIRRDRDASISLALIVLAYATGAVYERWRTVWSLGLSFVVVSLLAVDLVGQLAPTARERVVFSGILVMGFAVLMFTPHRFPIALLTAPIMLGALVSLFVRQWRRAHLR